MKIGISVSSSYAVDDGREAPRLMIERAQVAYAAGLASLSVGDHHNMSGPYVQNTPVLGRLMAEWAGRPAGLLFLFPIWHPLIAAEQIGTLAAIHDGPFIVQTGIGSGDAQFRALGTEQRERGRRLDEAITVVKRLLAGETVDSPMFAMEAGHVGLLPPAPVSWWIGAGADVALERAARVGDCWYGGPGVRRQDAAGRLEVYHSMCAQHGSTPRSALRRDVLALRDGERAHRLAEQILSVGYRGLGVDQLVIGGPDEVTEQLAELATIGFDEVVVRCMAVDQADALETIEVVGEIGAVA